MEETAGGRPTFGVVGCGAVPAGLAGDDEAPCELAVGSPVQEVPGAGGTGRPFGQPIVDVALGAAGQVALAGGQEGQEGDGGVQADLGVPGGCARRPGGFGSLAGPAQDAPTRIGAQQPALALVSDAFQAVGSPGLEAHEGVVAPGQHAVGDEQVAQVVGALARVVGIEGLVGEGELAGGDFAQQAGRRRAAQPVVGAVRLGCRGYRLVDGPQRPVGCRR